jgi:hypothetical protein
MAPEVEAAPTEAPDALRMSDNPTLVEKVQKNLDAFEGVVTDASAETPDGNEPVETPAKTPAKAPDGNASDEVISAEVPDKKPDEKPVAAAAKTASTLPAAYRRSAKAREWTDEEIDGFYSQSPELAIKTFERLHDSRVKEVEQWAELGRKAKSQAPAPAPTPEPAADPLAALKPLDVKAMVEKFGNEELISELAGPVNAAIAALQPLMKDAIAARQIAQQTQKDALAKSIGDFFANPDMKAYSDVYGTDWASLTAKQWDVRNRVLEVADSLIAGAQLQGRAVSVAEAMTLAHETVAGQFKEKVIREQLRQTVTQRGRGLTLKPSNRGSIPAGPPTTRTEMESRAADRLREVFG